MIQSSQVQPHMEVIGSDNEHVGTVDHLDPNDSIKLTRTDMDADGSHHWIPLSWAESIDNGRLKLGRSAKEAFANWMTSQPEK